MRTMSKSSSLNFSNWTQLFNDLRLNTSRSFLFWLSTNRVDRYWSSNFSTSFMAPFYWSSMISVFSREVEPPLVFLGRHWWGTHLSGIRYPVTVCSTDWSDVSFFQFCKKYTRRPDGVETGGIILCKWGKLQSATVGWLLGHSSSLCEGGFGRGRSVSRSSAVGWTGFCGPFTFSPRPLVWAILGKETKRLLEPLIFGHGWLGGCGNQLAVDIGVLVLTLYRFVKLVGKEAFVG